MTEFQALEVAQKHYFFELERKDRINRELVLPITLAGAYFSVFALTWSGFAMSGFVALLFKFAATASMAFALAFVLVFPKFFGHIYQRADGIDQVMLTYFQAEDFDAENPVAEGASSLGEKQIVYRDLSNCYARCAKHNLTTNHAKSAILLQSNRRITGALFFIGLAYPLFLAAN